MDPSNSAPPMLPPSKSTPPMLPSSCSNMMNHPLHYFTGRVRAFWRDLVFFSDAKNVAVVKVCDLYMMGRPATPRDMGYLKDTVENNDWKRSLELHSYVSEYPCGIHPPWPYQFSGKTLWRASYAWFGYVPETIRKADVSSIVYEPISYYTGTVFEFYDDNIIFGDYRNSVIVTFDNFFMHGERGFREEVHDHLLNSAIHAYITRLEVLTDNCHGGPEPDLPTWPSESCSVHPSRDMWVAKFAWYGEVPKIVKNQVARYKILRLNQWGYTCSAPQQNRRGWQGFASEEEFWKEKNSKNELESSEVVPCQLLVPTEQKAGLMRGLFLIANNKQGLMTSYTDVIAFTKDNFYVNGQKFKHDDDLDCFFVDHAMTLRAWVVPFDKPKVMFNINVAWHAACVWWGKPPEDLECIKMDACEELDVKLLESTFYRISLSHFMGNVSSLSYESGELISTAGLDKAVKITFNKKAVYMHGRGLPSRCSLLDNQQTLQSNMWSVLAYPEATDQSSGIPHYQALVMWHRDEQDYMAQILCILISEFVNETWHHKGKETLDQQISGHIEHVTKDYGIIKIGEPLIGTTNLYFKKEALYIDGVLFPRNVSLQSVEGRLCNVLAKAMPPKIINGYEVTMDATLVWVGRKPSFELIGKFISEDDEEPGAAKLEIQSHSKPENVLHAAEGVMVGSIFLVNEHYGLLICSDVIVPFSSDILYVYGKRFDDKHGSLVEFCSDKKVTVRAMIASLKEPKVFMNCWVVCEAVCVWIGQEPGDLTLLQKEHFKKQRNKTSDIPKVSHKALLYLTGHMVLTTEDVAILASTTAEGTSKIIFSKRNLFLNGTAVHQNDVFEQCKRNSSQNWSVLALSTPPKDVKGHLVCYTAVAVWDINNHHRMRKTLSLIANSDKFPYKQEHCTSGKLNRLSKTVPDSLEALLQHLHLWDSIREESEVSSQQSDPSMTVSHNTKGSSVDLAYFASIEKNCGKHITGYILKKLKGGGVAHWKSQLFEGYVFIEFNTESLYLNSKPVGEEWRVCDVQSRPCSFYVIPVPHHSVGGHVVSLKATCGWIGKKPPDLPSPGSQPLPNIDLSSVHVTQQPESQCSELDITEVESPEECYQNRNNVKESVTSAQPNSPQTSGAPKVKAKGNMIQGTQKGGASGIECKVQSQTSPLLASECKDVESNEYGKIWEDKNRNKYHHQGTIAEVYSSVCQLKGDDGKLYCFSRESCFLYGVPLSNVELWHVLSQDDAVLYTVLELTPGIMKVCRVWLGTLQLPDKKTATDYILDWSRVKLVPDGARDILLSQLEMQ